MTRGKDRCISIFSKDEWDCQQAKFESMFTKERERRAMSEIFFHNHTELDLVSNGYSAIDIPAELKNWARIENEFIIIARSHRIEIWSKSKYESYCKDIDTVVLERCNLSLGR